MIRFNFISPNEHAHSKNRSNPKKYLFKESARTPLIFLSPASSSMLLKGACSPERPEDFFESVALLLDAFYENGHHLRQITFHLTHIGSDSSRFILELIQRVVEPDRTDKHIDITWFYDPEDADVLLTGKNLAEYSKAHMNFILFS